jgi:UDP-glucose 4-epimerase
MEQPDLYWSINRDGTRSLLDAMAQAGAGALVFSSTCAVFGVPERVPMDEDLPHRPISVYGQTKAAMELEIAASGLPHVILRYFNAAGAAADGALGERHDPETHLIPRALRAARDGTELDVHGGDYPTPDGTCVRDYVHVEDLAAAHVAAVERLLGGGASLDLQPGLRPRRLRAAGVRRGARGHGPAAAHARRARAAPAIRPSSTPAPTAPAASMSWQPRFDDLAVIVRHAWQALRD